MRAPHDPDLTELQTRWAGRWDIWRARRGDDPDARDGQLLAASRLDEQCRPA